MKRIIALGSVAVGALALAGLASAHTGSQGSFDDPSLWQHDKVFDLIRALDDLRPQ